MSYVRYPVSGGTGTVTSITAGTGLTGGTITTSGTIALQIPVLITNGGTGQVTAAAAYNALTPLTTTGDTVYEASAGTAARLAIGSTGNVLTVAGGIPAWAPPATSGTVTSVSVTTANGVSGSVATATTTPAISLTLGAITPSSVAASGSVTGSNLSGTNTGDQTITLTGAVTGSGTGSFATTYAGTVPIATGGTGQTTAAAAFNALNPMTTTGDLIYESGANTASRLAVGNNGQTLVTTAGVPTWGSTIVTQNASGNTVLATAYGDLVIFADSTSAAFNITLPSPSANTLRRINIKDSTGQLGTNNVTIVRNGSEQIEGLAASYVLQASWSSTAIMSNGTNWFII